MSEIILFFGNERLATGVSTDVPILKGLLAAGYRVAAVVVAQGSTGSSRKARELEIAVVARQANIPLLALPKLREAHNQLQEFHATAAVLAAYGKIVPLSVIELFPRGIINVHPSLLPRHRGPTPIESAILNGDAETGVSLMHLSPEMDAGPVFVQQALHLKGNETKQALTDQLANLGKDLLVRYLPDILSGALDATPQGHSDVQYDHLINKDAGLIDTLAWQKPAEELERQIRAYAGWPRTRTTLGTTDIIITAAHTGPTEGTPGTLSIESKQLGVHTGKGTLLIDRLIPVGKKEMTGQAFLAGYHV